MINHFFQNVVNSRASSHKVLLFIIPFVVFSGSLWGEFVYDDIAITVTQNPALTGEASLLDILSWDRPLREFTYILDHALWEMDPTGYHLQNLLWHSANSVLLYCFLLYLGIGTTKSLVVSVLFAIHPIQTESVAWVSGRKELLCLFFELAACYCFTASVMKSSSEWSFLKQRDYWLSLVCLILALLSKQVAAALPMLMLVSVLLFVANHQRGADWHSLLKALVLPVAITLLTVLFSYDLLGRVSQNFEQGSFYDPASRDISFSFISAILTPFAVFFKTVILYVYPVDLAIERGFQPVTSLLDTRWMLGCAALVGLVSSAYRLRKSHPAVAAGVAWYLASWLPVSGLLPVGYLLADRYLYIPSIGFLLIVVEIASRGIARHSWLATRHIALVVAGLLLFLGITSFNRTLEWQNEITLWESAVASRPDLAKPHFNLGNAYSDLGRFEKATDHWFKALELQEIYPQVWQNMGNAHKRQGNSGSAEECYRKALEQHPQYGTAHYNLALVLEDRGDQTGALQHFQFASRYLYGKRNTHYRKGLAYYHIARLQFETRNIIAAKSNLLQAERNAPNHAPIYMLKGVILDRDYQNASQAFEIALSLEPEYAEAYFNYGVLNYRVGKFDQAEQLWGKALEIKPYLSAAVDRIRNAS